MLWGARSKGGATLDREILPPSDETPLLTWWRGIYEHVFVALNPFVRIPANSDEDGPDRFADLCKREGEAVSWEQVHREAAPEAPQQNAYEAIRYFAVGLRDFVRPQLREKMLAYMDREQKLYYPNQDTMAPIMEPAIGRFLATLGVSSVMAWDEFRDYSRMLPLFAFERARPAILLPKALTDPGVWCLQLSDPAMLITWQWDDVVALIAMSDTALSRARPEAFFEGWYAGESTKAYVFAEESFASRRPPPSPS